MKLPFGKTWCIAVLLAAGCWFCAGMAPAQTARFPQPDFDSGYRIPETQVPAGRGVAWEYIDAAVLIGALAVVTVAVLKWRRRAVIFALGLATLGYFGFWRRGCICPVGSIQNLTAACADSAYALPVTVLVLFTAPLIVALFWGRTFCAAVCPLGFLQDLFAIRPLRLPVWLARGLGILPYVSLGLAVLFVATGSGFLICRHDPFVAFFRGSGEAPAILIGLAMLGFGVFIARPYCRFLCPYGVLLGWMSVFSRRHATITPDECIRCRLCEDACPFGAINRPQPELQLKDRKRAALRLKRVLLWILPILVVSVLLGAAVRGPLARVHPTVRLAESIGRDRSQLDLALADRRQAFDASRRPLEELQAEAAGIRVRFASGAPILGLFLGLVVSAKLIRFSVREYREGYEPDRATCFSCGRCFAYCPKEQKRRSGGSET